MGLDMYAYVAKNGGEMKEYYDNYSWDNDSSSIPKPREIAYWRKHPNLHGWMEQLWNEKGRPGSAPLDPWSAQTTMFNGVELELDWQDLDKLEYAVKHKKLPGTRGFFFGDDADDYYRDQDLKFIGEARTELFHGMKVFYNSSW